MPDFFGHYELLELLGRGGMGEVYRARDTRRQREVALKVLPAHLAADGQFAARFRRESLLAAQLSEPHIVPIHDFGEIDGRLFIDMRLVRGTDLANRLQTDGPLAPEVAVDVTRQVASALDAAHVSGLVHRDVKPSNVMLTGITQRFAPFAYLVDFGIARATQGMTALTTTSATVGTVAYMSPERIANRPFDHRADVYSLACVLYEMLTARPPFTGDVVALMYAHMTKDPPRVTALARVPDELDAVIAKGMAKDPDERYASAPEFAIAATDALHALTPAPNPPVRDDLDRTVRQPSSWPPPDPLPNPSATPQPPGDAWTAAVTYSADQPASGEQAARDHGPPPPPHRPSPGGSGPAPPGGGGRRRPRRALVVAGAAAAVAAVALGVSIPLLAGGDGKPTASGRSNSRLSSAARGPTGSSAPAAGLGSNPNTTRTIQIAVEFSGAQLTAFESALGGYAQQQGITIKWQSDALFPQNIATKVQAGDPPDIALFPQPGLVRDLAQQGKLADLGAAGLDVSGLRSQLIAGAEDAGTVNGRVYGIPASINVTSLVFYPKKAWGAAGLQAPTSLDDLLTFSARLRSEGKTPWCMGIESGTATGWPATDWIEQLILGMYGTQTYDDWVSHRITFADPRIRGAFDYFQEIFSTSGWINGGRSSIATTAFGTAGNPMFDANNTESKPGCYLFKQGNFIAVPGFFPTPILSTLDKNVGVFAFPGKSASDRPIEGSGEVAGLFSGHNPYAIKLLKYMMSPTFCSSCPKSFTYVSPFTAYAASNYPSTLTRTIASIADHATAFAFDGSDAMPPVVGAGSFWSGMTRWISGAASLPVVLAAIDASWPK